MIIKRFHISLNLISWKMGLSKRRQRVGKENRRHLCTQFVRLTHEWINILFEGKIYALKIFEGG
jgi:hypothetical protein